MRAPVDEPVGNESRNPVAPDRYDRDLTTAEITLQMELAAHRETLERAVIERDETIAQLRNENLELRTRLADLAHRAVTALQVDPSLPDGQHRPLRRNSVQRERVRPARAEPVSATSAEWLPRSSA